MVHRRSLLQLVGANNKPLVEPKGTVEVVEGRGGLQHFQHSRSPTASQPVSKMR